MIFDPARVLRHWRSLFFCLSLWIIYSDGHADSLWRFEAVLHIVTHAAMSV